MSRTTVFTTNPDKRAEAGKRYREGWSLRELADEYDVSYGHARDVVLGQGVTLRPKGGVRRG